MWIVLSWTNERTPLLLYSLAPPQYFQNTNNQIGTLTGEEAALNELVRVLAHDLTVLARPRLRLVRVHHQERRPPVRLGWQKVVWSGGSAQGRVQLISCACSQKPLSYFPRTHITHKISQ